MEQVRVGPNRAFGKIVQVGPQLAVQRSLGELALLHRFSEALIQLGRDIGRQVEGLVGVDLDLFQLGVGFFLQLEQLVGFFGQLGGKQASQSRRIMVGFFQPVLDT